MGTLATQRVSGWRLALRLGRVSNLPTVWSNVIAACALAGGAPLGTVVLLSAAMSLLYVGGMFLNDAYDADHDMRVRPERPIPSGDVGVLPIFTTGFALLGAGVLAAAAINARAGWPALALAGAIVLYDWRHKGVAWSPLVMGLCRALVYLTAGVAVMGSLNTGVTWPALALLAYVAGLTYAARLEVMKSPGRLWPLILLAVPGALAVWWMQWSPAAALALAVLLLVVGALGQRCLRSGTAGISRSIGLLIAGIAVNDALFAATAGAQYATLACLVCFGLTLVLQRHVPGT